MDLDNLDRIAKAATPGPWLLATSNSWRRFVTKFDTRSVCEPVTYSDQDRHPDLHFRNGGADGPDATFMQTFDPSTVSKLLAVVKAAKYVARSNGFDAALPGKMAALRAALDELEPANGL